MKTKFTRILLSISFLFLLTILIPPKTNADMFSNMFSNMFGNNGLFGNQSSITNSDAQNNTMEMMQQEFMNNLMNQNNQEQSKDDGKVSASGFLSEKDGKYYIGDEEDGGLYRIVTEKGDMLAVMPLLAGVEVPVEFIGYYDEKKRTVYAERMNLLKRPSSDLMDEIDEAIKEYEKTQPISGKGYVVTKEDQSGYYLEVKKKDYKIITDTKDIETVLPLIADEDMIVELIGHLDEDDMTFEAEGLNFLTELDKELLEEIDRLLLENKDGEEVVANGYIRSRSGEYRLKIQGEYYDLRISNEHPDIQNVVEVLSNEELLVSLVGVIDLGNKTLDVNKLNIVDTPSTRLQRKIAKALEGYEEGDAAISGRVGKDGDSYTFSSDKKSYTMTAEKEDLITFLDIVQGEEDILVEVYGYVSNKEGTIKAEAASVIGDIPDNVREELIVGMSEYMEVPKTGSKVDVQGTIVSRGDKHYISVAFVLYEIKTKKHDIERALPVLSDTGLALSFTGVIDNDEKTINAEKLVILETPSDEIVEEMDEIIKNGGTSGTGNKGNDNKGNKEEGENSNNNPFGDFFGNSGLFENFFGNSDGENPFSGFFDNDNSPFGDLGGLFGGSDEEGESNSPFGDFGSLFGDIGGEGSFFSSLFEGAFGSNMSSLSFDQIQQQLSGFSGSSDIIINDNTGSDDNYSFGGDSDGSGFSVGGDN